jgi:hypothetical protein
MGQCSQFAVDQSIANLPLVAGRVLRLGAGFAMHPLLDYLN